MRFFPIQRLRPFFPLALLLSLSAGQLLFAQAPAWQDATSPGSGQGTSTAVDSAGNIYFTGYFRGMATFGGITLTSTGGEDIFVAKRTPAGAWQWATSVGGIGDDRSLGVAVDGSGNVVVTGYFTSPTITFGNTTLTNITAVHDVFVAKLTPTSAWQWATGASGRGFDIGYGVAVDGSGGVVVTGGFTSPTITFGTTTLTQVGYFDLFVAKLSPTGVWQWATSAGGSEADLGFGVAVDGSGSVVATGTFVSPTISFGAITLTNGGSSSDVFVAKLTPTGTWQWATRAGGNDEDYSAGVAVDGSGSVVVTGGFYSPILTFGATTLTNVNAGSLDLFVAKLTPTGAWQWVTGAGGSGNDQCLGVAVDGSGSVVVTGRFDSPTLPFGATTLTNANTGDTEVFVAKLTPTGAWQWATAAGGSGSDYGLGVAVDGSGGVVVTGGFSSPTITFGSTTLTNSIPNPGLNDYAIFLARLSTANGLPEDPTAASFTLTPNPARTTVQLTGTPGAAATLLDGLGRVVGTATLSPAGTATLAVGTLPAGLYLVRVGGSKAQRLVVE